MPVTLPLKMATAALAAGVALGLVHIACVIGLHVPFDPNEGWNAIFADAAIRTGSPYPPAQAMLVNNYPPLSFYLVGALARLTGDAIIAGRFVALAAFVAVTLGIDAAARRMGCSRIEALFAAMLFAAQLLLTTDYVGMNDPQLLGHAIAMGGLLLLLREPRTPRDVVFAAALFVLAFFAKHNLVVLPAAVGLWLLLADRRLAVTFIASGIVFLLIGLGVFKTVFGISLFAQIDSARSFAWSNVTGGLGMWLRFGAVPLAGAATLAVIAHRERDAVLCLIYVGVALLTGAFFLGGAGVDTNAMFDADIALALCAGLLLNRLGSGLPQAFAAALYLVPACFLVFHLDANWRDGDFWSEPLAQEQATAGDEIALIKSTDGPVLCDVLALCYWARKPPEVDVFNMQQAFVTGARNDKPLADAIAGHQFALIELERYFPPLTPRIHAAIADHYNVEQVDDDRVFYTPR